jgi:hypothetical protein
MKRRGVCHLANVPFGECTIWRMNHLANVPFGECTIWLLHKNKKTRFWADNPTLTPFLGRYTVGPIGQKALNKVSSHPHRIYLTEWTFIS